MCGVGLKDDAFSGIATVQAVQVESIVLGKYLCTDLTVAVRIEDILTNSRYAGVSNSERCLCEVAEEQRDVVGADPASLFGAMQVKAGFTSVDFLYYYLVADDRS